MKITTLLPSKVLLLLIAIAFSINVQAIERIQLKPGDENRLDVTENSYLRMQVVNTFNTFSYLDLTTLKGQFTQLYAKGYSKSSTLGNPELPVMSRLIEVPADAVPQIKILSYEIREYKLSEYGINNRLFPLQPPQPKNGKEPVEFVYNEGIYRQNQFIGEELAKVEIQGYLRGVRLANLVISPVQYNPVTNTIRIYDNLVVDIRFTGADLSKTRQMRSQYDSPYFRSIYNRLLNLQPVEKDRDTITKMPVKYVIVSPPMFHDALQPFVQWKTRKGFTVVQAYTDNPAVGTTFNSIKAYLQDLYTSATPSNPAPTFVLIVGDVAQIPSYDCGGHVSDLYYCEYSGDFLPEVYYGRFSATNVAQLQPQIDKTLEYEKYEMPDPSYLNECVMVAGADASHQIQWGNGQINYGTDYYFNLEHNLTSHTYLQPEPSGANYSQSIQNDVSNGVCFANYTAHGSVSGWADPSFEIGDIPGLQNAHQYSLMVGNCCQTSTFDQTSFAEELLRAENKGALGYIGASNNSYWDEDYYWGVGVGPIVEHPTYEDHGLGAYDRTFHDHGEPYDDWYSTMDQMVFAGNLAVQESNSSSKQYYWEIYCLMGDPSLMVYFSVPPALSVDYTELLPMGSLVFSVQTEPYAYVAISKNNVLHGAVEADASGQANISLLPFTEPGYAHVVITKQNRQPFIDSVMVASPAGAYLVLDSYQFKDTDGNNNQLVEFGEPFTLDVTMENFGSADAINALSTLSTIDPYVTITDAGYTWPLISSNGSATALSAFSIQADSYVPDLHNVNFTLTSTADTNTFVSNLSVQVFAPNITTGIFSVDDSQAGNGDGRMDPGETIYVTIPTSNTGHASSAALVTNLFAFGDFITVNAPSQSFPSLVPGNTVESTFSFTISPEAPLGYQFSLYFTAAAGPYTSISSLFPTIGPQVEDFETNSFSKYSWVMAGNKNWLISPSTKYEGSYGSMSGNIGNAQRTEMYLDVVVYSADTLSFYRKVSSESGYDYLKFYLNNVEMGKWSGAKDWERVSFVIPAGQHRLRWAYETDESTLSGQNAGWIDYIVFPPFSEMAMGSLTVNVAAVPPAICPGGSSQLYAFATGGNGRFTYEWTPSESLNNSSVFNPIATPGGNTSYQVHVTSISYSSNSSIDVIISQLPATPAVVIEGNHLSSSSPSGNQWYNSQGPIEGATGQTYVPAHTDSYYTIVTNESGCLSEPSTPVFFGFTGINPSTDDVVFKTFPNPFSNKLFVSYRVTETTSVKLVLYNAIGTEVLVINEGEKNPGSYKITLDGSNLSSGIYYCKMYSGNEVLVAKLIRN